MEHYWNGQIGEDFKAEPFDFAFSGKNYSLYSSDSVFSSFKADRGSLILTSVLLEKIPMYLKNLSFEKLEFFNALDLGCGNGLISILLADCMDRYRADMTDISPRALKLSDLNIKKFSMESRLKAFESDKFEKITKSYDIIYTNPPIRTGKSNVHSIFQDSKAFLKQHGEFYAVIRKSHGAPSAIKKLREVYGNCEVLKKSKGFYVLCSKNIP